MSGIRGNLGSNSDWRKIRPGRKQKLAYILETKDFTDVTFRIGNATNSETITAHRLVLSMYSGVFEAMFQGPLAGPSDEVIDVPDIQPSAFRALLKFIYTGEFDRELSTENALGVLYAAKKYDVTDLELVCTDYLKTLITYNNAVSIFQTAQLLDVNDLRDEAQAFIIRSFDSVSITDDFLNMSEENLCSFLKDDDTRGAELDIFNGVLRWAEAECNRQSFKPSNLREILKDVLVLIRFPIMTSEEIALQIIPHNVLTAEESTLLFQHMVVPLENRHLLPPIPFNIKKRNCSIYIARFYESVAKSAYVDISAGWFNKFSVDQPISIVSYGFYGPHTAEAASYEVCIKIMRDSADGVLAEVPKQTVLAKMKEIFHVKFPTAVPVFPGSNYRAWFSIKGPPTCHGTATAPVQEVIVPVSFVKYGQVKFTYQVTGAHQLPEIAFQI